MTRSQARVLLMQMLYEMDIQNDFSEQKKSRFLENNGNGMNEQPRIFFDSIYQLVTEHKDEIDSMIDKLGNKWSIATMSKVDVAILRLAAAELFYTETPVSVTINEAVELGKKFSGDQSGGFINGMLASMVKEKNAQ